MCSQKRRPLSRAEGGPPLNAQIWTEGIEAIIFIFFEVKIVLKNDIGSCHFGDCGLLGKY